MALRVGNVSRLAFDEPKCLNLGTPPRQVTVVRTLDGTVRCFDSFCYHFGGPLGKEGTISIVDIEDIGTHPIIKCPSHGHEISLQTGEVFERDLYGKVQPGKQVQRVHGVTIDTMGDIYITLNLAGFVPSDKYASIRTETAVPGQHKTLTAGMRVRKAMAASRSKPAKPAQPSQTQPTLPMMFANQPSASQSPRKLQYSSGTQLTIPQAFKQAAVSQANTSNMEMDCDED
eukprot:TRINITY_DN38397_c0_g1_i2.p1 TRINITY_DN38397_c0_g1~~TRINITY_DN38397_c0_g1_i2.p1  ORF type:complete len:230 (+),score=10.01 TRINITY_DN38397_c0_g1_i2:142-831(+)